MENKQPLIAMKSICWSHCNPYGWQIVLAGFVAAALTIAGLVVSQRTDRTPPKHFIG